MAKAMVKNVRLSYVRLFEAQQVNGQGEATFSVCLLIRKDSPEVPKIKEAGVIHKPKIEIAFNKPVNRGSLVKKILPKTP